MIQVEHIRKSYAGKIAVDDISFSATPGQVVALVGPNGAGKTTILRMIAGFFHSDKGQIVVAGHDVIRESEFARRNIGYLPESAPMYMDMRVEEYLRFRAAIKGIPPRNVTKRITTVLEITDIGGHRRRLIGQLSRGFRQRVGLADALIAAPPVLIFDEPLSGLDPIQANQFCRLMDELASDHTVLISSHSLAHLETMTSQIVVIVDGRVAAEGTATQLQTLVGLGDSSLERVFLALIAEAHTQARTRHTLV